jgi:molybdopterin-guanine dinucleotide biosynthesis protein A
MKTLGAVLAGGASTRFGSDKALADFAGKPLLDHVISALLPQVETLVIIGRDYQGYTRVDDLPGPGLGPIGGLCGALHHGLSHGYDAVLCVPCDTLGIPEDLLLRLSPGPAVACHHRVIGLWPTSLAAILLARLTSGGSRALHVWATATQAREVDCGPLHNINHASQLG